MSTTPTIDDLPAGRLAPDPAAAPAIARVLAQARFDATVLLRNGEQLLLTLVLPALLLVALAVTSVPDLGRERRIDLATPGVLALAVLSTAFTGQAIGTGFDRRYGVLRLLGTTPLGRRGLLAGRALAVLAVEVVQIAVLGLLGAALGWRPDVGGVLPAALAVLVATAAFVSLGLLLAGTLRAEATLAVANGLYLLLLAVGGVVIPAGRLPAAVEPLVSLLPSAALGQGLRDVLLHGSGLPVQSVVVLLVWTGIGGVLTARTFRWS